MGNTTTIPLVFNTNCSLPGEPGPTCYHFLPCNAVTRNCECGSIPYTLCSQPLRYNDTYLQANFLAVKGVIFSLQGIVVILSIALLIGHVVKRGKFFVKPTREQAALCVVLCCAVVNILYTALDPFWTQFDLTQPVESIIFWLGDLFIAFLAAGYGLMAGLWLSIQLTPLTRVSPTVVMVGLWVLILLPFVTSIVAYAVRATAAPGDGSISQYLFFAVLVFVSLIYGIVVVVAGIRTLRSLASVSSLQKDEGRRALLIKITRHVVFGGIVLMMAIVCLIIFVTVPSPNALVDLYVTGFAPQIIVFILQVFLLWLFRARITPKDPSRSVSSGPKATTVSNLRSQSLVASSEEVPVSRTAGDMETETRNDEAWSKAVVVL